jgi:hypothetical protein
MIQAFQIHTPTYDAASCTLRFGYDVPKFGAFEEQVVLPEDAALDALSASVRERLLALCAVVIGTSYFKAAPVESVKTEFGLTPAARQMAELAYGPGLGEFYVRNDLTYPPALRIEAEAAEPVIGEPSADVDTPRAAVAFGGGKDSHVASSIIAEAGATGERFSIILADQVGARLQAMSETPVRLIKRRIDPRLIEISRSGEALNGHIPITAINSTVLTLIAEAMGLNWVVFANERAASEPTMEANGHPVNHQFSKSLAFEDALRSAFAEAGARARYFSVLRPVSELWTAHYLATRAKAALDIFASCNRNFVFAGPSVLADGQRWCGECAKCVYTSVLLAPFLTPERHAAVFQSEVLDNLSNFSVLREIAGLTDAKPWECVGERREVAAALYHLLTDDDWKNALVVAGIEAELFAQWDETDLKQAWAEALDARSDHRMPEAVAKVVQA